jgi:hypothetical protein
MRQILGVIFTLLGGCIIYGSAVITLVEYMGIDGLYISMVALIMLFIGTYLILVDKGGK